MSHFHCPKVLVTFMDSLKIIFGSETRVNDYVSV